MQNDERLTELEIAVSHQQRLLDELNQVIVDQQEQLDGLKKELMRLDRRLSHDGSADEQPAA